jgi:hypothetical protein
MGERSRLPEFQAAEEPLLVLQEQSEPSCGGYRPKRPDQTRQSEARAVSYQDGEGSSGTNNKRLTRE